MPIRTLATALQSTDEGVFLPEDAGSALVWVVFIGVIAVLYTVISRTRRRAEQDFWDKQRAERDRQTRPEPDDPAEL